MASNCCGRSDCEGHWTIPVRIIRSFEYRTTRTVVLKDVCPKWNRQEFIQEIRTKMSSSSSVPKAFLKHDFNCVKILHKPHSFKTNNPVINLDHDDWILEDDDISLHDLGLVYAVHHLASLQFFILPMQVAFDQYMYFKITNIDHLCLPSHAMNLVGRAVVDRSLRVDQTEMTFFNRAEYEQYKVNPVYKTS